MTSSSHEILFTFGRPLSPLYSLVMVIRQHLYRKNILSVHRLPLPVISVGNLTMGGTGKTPVVAYIAASLQAIGHRPAIISRGYGGSARDAVNIVSDGNTIFLGVEEAGDEPYMLARQLRGIPILTGRMRVHPCRYAAEQLGASIIILDDGFQHLSIARDIDLVLFNATSLAGNSRVFPGGELREPVSALHRASAFLITGIDDGNKDRAEKFADLLQKKAVGKPVFFSSTDYTLTDIGGHSAVSSLPPTLHAFCAIAHPDRFFTALSSLNFTIAGQTSFPDHHRYSRKEMDMLCRRAKETGAQALVTTEKDQVKLESMDFPLPLYTLKTTLRTDTLLPTYLRETLSRISSH